MFQQDNNKWSCKACTFKNNYYANQCKICETRKYTINNTSDHEFAKQLQDKEIIINKDRNYAKKLQIMEDKNYAEKLHSMHCMDNKQINIINNNNEYNITTLLNQEITHINIKPINVNDINGISINLFKHQQKGVAWMLEMESNNKYKGGFLFDEMGIGKTIQIIALCLLTKNKFDQDLMFNHYEPSTKKRKLSNNNDNDKQRTLIVCPVAILDQWYDEISTKAPNQFNVCIYHGCKRYEKWIKNFKIYDYDIIITTYDIILSEYKFKNMFCGLLYLSFQKFFYRIVLDEAHIIKNSETDKARACKGIYVFLFFWLIVSH